MHAALPEAPLLRWSLSQVLFFKLHRDEVELGHDSGKVRINAPVLAAVRDAVAGKLVADAADYVKGLPDL